MSDITTADKQFDHMSQEVAQDPFPLFDEMRSQQCPVGHSDLHGGFYIPTRYEDIAAIAYDPETFSSGRITIPNPVSSGLITDELIARLRRTSHHLRPAVPHQDPPHPVAGVLPPQGPGLGARRASHRETRASTPSSTIPPATWPPSSLSTSLSW